MAPVPGMFISVILVGVVILVPICCLLLGIWFLFRGRRTDSRLHRRLGSGFCLVGLLGAGALVWLSWPKSLDQQARWLMKLPPQSQIIKVTDGDWVGDGTVVFRLPATHDPAYWVHLVWQMNLPSHDDMSYDERGIVADRYTRLLSTGEGNRRLQYDVKTGLYTYDVDLES